MGVDFRFATDYDQEEDTRASALRLTLLLVHLGAQTPFACSTRALLEAGFRLARTHGLLVRFASHVVSISPF